MATLQSLINVRRTTLDAAADIETVNQTAASLKRLEDKQAILGAELETVTAEIDASRSKLASLENPRGLLDILDQPEKRSQLRLEIAKRIAKIEVLFGRNPWLVLYFGNGEITGFFPVDEDAPPIPPLSSLPGNGYEPVPFKGGFFGDGGKLLDTPALHADRDRRKTTDVTVEMVKDFIRERNQAICSLSRKL